MPPGRMQNEERAPSPRASWITSRNTTGPNTHPILGKLSAVRCSTSSFRRESPITTRSNPTSRPTARALTTLSQKQALESVRHYGTKGWDSAVEKFRQEQGTLVERYERERLHTMIPLKLADGQEASVFPRQQRGAKSCRGRIPFAPGARLMSATPPRRILIRGQRMVLPNSASRSPITARCRMSDAERNWLFLVEAVTSHGPMSSTRIVNLEEHAFRGAPWVPFMSAPSRISKNSGGT